MRQSEMGKNCASRKMVCFRLSLIHRYASYAPLANCFTQGGYVDEVGVPYSPFVSS